jgi:hypothetical protein
MARRDSDMADLDAYIADSEQPDNATPLVDPNAPTEAVGAPTVGSTATGKTPVPQQNEPAPDKREDTTRASIREMERTQLEQEQQRRDESSAATAARQAAQSVSDNATRIGDNVRRVAGKASAAIGGIPIPGDLITPLVILLIFFFALVVINGHTRLSWLWLVLSGNAAITTGAGASFGQPTTVVTPPGQTVTPPVTPLATIMPFAGAGEPT